MQTSRYRRMVALVNPSTQSFLTSPLLYRCLLYAAIATLQGIAQEMGVVPQFCAYSMQLKSSKCCENDSQISFKGNCISWDKKFEGGKSGHPDADWAGDVDDCRYTSGNVCFLAREAVCWLSMTLSTVVLSIAEAEYMVFSTEASLGRGLNISYSGIFSANIPYPKNSSWDLRTVTQELTWFRQLLTDMGESQERPIDNQGAVAMVVMQDQAYRYTISLCSRKRTERSDHFGIRFHK